MTIKNEDLLTYTRRAMTTYGKMTNEDRAFPDYRDGLKPVHRRSMWALSHMPQGLVKSARVVGDVIAKYHPHGDTSVYGAIITMVQNPNSPIHGEGNWGTIVHSPAAMRYTNLKLSKYGETFLLPNYLNRNVTDFVPNYDDRDVEPVILPVQLPNLLMAGTMGIGLGMTSHIPSYTAKSLISVCVSLLNKEDLQIKDYIERLEFKFPWGGQLVKSKENRLQLAEFYKTGKGRINFKSRLVVDEEKCTIRWADFAINNPETVLDRIKLLVGVERVENTTNSDGVSYTIKYSKILRRDGTVPGKKVNGVWREAKKGNDTLTPFLQKIEKLTSSQKSFLVNFLERTKNGDKVDTKFYFEVPIPKLLTMWLKWRIQLEIKSLKYRIEEQNKAILSTKLFIHAVNNLDVIFKAIKTDDPAQYMVKHMEVNLDQANEILERKVKQLSKLSGDDLKAKLRTQKEHLEQLKGWLARPVSKVRTGLEQLAILFEGA